METAHKFAMDKLGCARVDVSVPATSTAAATPGAKPSGDNKTGEATLLKVKIEKISFFFTNCVFNTLEGFILLWRVVILQYTKYF